MKKDIQLAQEFFNENNYKNALNVYDQLEKTELGKTELENYMLCLCERLRYKESIQLAEKLLQLDSNNSKVFLNLCICYGKQGEYKKAIKYYEIILKKNPDFKENLGYYAYLLYRNDRLEESKRIYHIAIKEEPNNVWYISHYALLAEKMGEYEEAIECFKKAMLLTPEDTWLIKSFIFLYGRVNGKKEAYKYYDNLIKQQSNNYNLYINYAEYAIINDDVECAREILSKIKVIHMPIVLQVIYYVYCCFIYLYYDDISHYEINKKLLLEKRKNYNAYIHRDFSFLNNFAEKKLSIPKLGLYYEALITLREREE